MIELRKSHPNFRRKKFFQDRMIRRSLVRDIAWYRADGEEMTEEEWTSPWLRSMGLLLNGQTLDTVDQMGQPLYDDSFLILFNSYHEGVEFTLPESPSKRGWESILTTNNLDDPFQSSTLNSKIIVSPRCVVLVKERESKE
jgi:glycogen operon protein